MLYIVVPHYIIFSYYLTTTQTLACGDIKWTPDVSLYGSSLDIVFGQYFRQGMGKTISTKMCNEFVFQVLSPRSHPLWEFHSVKNERMECEIKIPLVNYSVFDRHHT